MQDIDDIFGVDDEDDTAPAGAKGKNPVAEQRKHIKELEAKLKDYEAKLPPLEEFKQKYDAEQRENSIKTTFSELGVPERAVKFFKLENPEGEVTKETVAKWAVENEFASPEDFSGTEETDQGFVPTVHGDSFIPGAKRYSRKDFEKALGEGPAAALAAQKALQEGRVDMQRE